MPAPGLFFSFILPTPPTVFPEPAGALLGPVATALAACMGCRRLLVGVEDNNDLRISPLAGLGGPVGVWRVFRFKFHVMRLDGEGDARIWAAPPLPLTTVAREPRGAP